MKVTLHYDLDDNQDTDRYRAFLQSIDMKTVLDRLDSFLRSAYKHGAEKKGIEQYRKKWGLDGTSEEDVFDYVREKLHALLEEYDVDIY